MAWNLDDDIDPNSPDFAQKAPISDAALGELAKSNPDLVAQYRAKMAGPNANLQSARSMQDYGNVANAIGKGLNAYGNAKRAPDVVLANRMQDLGKTPVVSHTPQTTFDPSDINDVTAQGVQRAQQDRQSAQDEFGAEQKLTDTGRQRASQDKAQAVTDAHNDPNAPIAAQARTLLKATYAEKARAAEVAGDTDAAASLREQGKTAGDGMSANDVMSQHTAIKDLDYSKVAQIQANNEYRQSLIDVKKQGLQNQADATEAKQSAAEDKQQQQTRERTLNLLGTARGRPDVAQAEKDLYAASKVDSLANVYGDPGKLSGPQVNLLVADVGKIASGGAPTQHELDGLTPNTLQGTLAGAWSRLSNSPTPANAAAFVKQYQDYAHALAKDARKTVRDSNGPILESQKAHLHPEDYAGYKAQFVDRFADPEAAMTGSKAVKSYKDLP